jgi:hypothetical protein
MKLSLEMVVKSIPMWRERNPSLLELTEKRICCVGWMDFEDFEDFADKNRKKGVRFLARQNRSSATFKGHVTSFELISF